jgi:hypothetical protein
MIDLEITLGGIAQRLPWDEYHVRDWQGLRGVHGEEPCREMLSMFPDFELGIRFRFAGFSFAGFV